MPGVVAFIDQRTQVGQEASAGTPTPCNRRLADTMLEFGDEYSSQQYNPTGHRLDSLSLPNMLWTSLTASGPMSYTETCLLIEAFLGAVSASGVGTNGHRRIYDLPLTGAITAKTLTSQFGDDTYANQAAYGLLTSFGGKHGREVGSVLDGCAGFAYRTLDGGVTFTPTPTVLAEAPVRGPHLNFYLDTTSANLGVTQITEEVLEAQWNVKDIQKPFWASDRAQTSFKKPISNESGKYTAKLSLGESSVTRAIDATLVKGRTYFLRIDNQGDELDNSQTITITGTPAGGTFTLTYKGATTAPIAYNANASAVQTALLALSTIGTGNVVCTGGALPGTPVVCNFLNGVLANDTSLLTHTDSFTGGSSPAAAITQLLTPYQFTIDIAVKLMKKAKWGNKNSVYARDFDFTIVEDATWGHGLMMTVVNGLTAL